jgi:hypothetical protein
LAGGVAFAGTAFGGGAFLGFFFSLVRELLPFPMIVASILNGEPDKATLF